MRKFAYIIATSIVILFFFLMLWDNYSDRFKKVEQDYSDNKAVNLVYSDVKYDDLKEIFVKNNYFPTDSDAYFAAKHLINKLKVNKPLSSLYDLNKRAWQIPTSEIDEAENIPGFKERLNLSRLGLGIDSIYTTWVNTAADKSHKINLADKKYFRIEELGDSTTRTHYYNGTGKITVNVSRKGEGKWASSTPVENVAVRLSEEYIVDPDADTHTTDSHIICYAITDDDGNVVFDSLDVKKSYSVLPIQPGCEYGSPKGTIGGNLIMASKDSTGVIKCNFNEQDHLIRVFDPTTMYRVNNDSSLTARSPKQYKDTLTWYIGCFFIAWWMLFIVLTVRRKQGFEGILSILMMLTGLSLLTMFSINDPLTDKMIGIEMAQGIIAGVFIIGLFQFVNFTKFFTKDSNHDKIRFDFFGSILKSIFKYPHNWLTSGITHLAKISSNEAKGSAARICAALGAYLFVALRFSLKPLVNPPKGLGYMIAALFLTALLWTPLGHAIGGMKVNLNLGVLMFQPSEIAKYLIILFLAAFFCENHIRIKELSEEGYAIRYFGKKFKTLFPVLFSLLILMGLYLLLGDMGPALVIAFTFITIYSLTKSNVYINSKDDEKSTRNKVFTCDFAKLVFGIVTFVICLWVGSWIDMMGLFASAWFAVWIAVGWIKKHIFESPVLFNLIIAAFIFTGSILEGTSVAERLESRTEMCTNTWGTLPDEDINGIGDPGSNTQVAEGLWGLASGGFWGQGLGNGSPHFIPAFHTDMILESIGEQMGFFGILAVFVLMALLLRKTIIAGYRTDNSFALYLCLGIAIVTAVQLIIIALGSTGIIPLTGVTVPFLSYGRVSMILNIAAFGIVLSIATNNQAKKTVTAKQYDYPLAMLSAVYTAFTIAILCIFVKYLQIDRDEILVRPAFVTSNSGLPVLAYNPRITQISNKMEAGEIYDRNGVLLATSVASHLKGSDDIYNNLDLKIDTTKIVRRHYPFGEHLFFMLGDFNTQLYFSSSDNNPRGYMAESRYLSHLRGFDNVLRDDFNEPRTISYRAKNYSPNRYFSMEHEYNLKDLQLRDYTALLPYLKNGLYSDNVRLISRNELEDVGEVEPNDVQLTIDARLQTRLQQEIALRIDSFARKYPKTNWNRTRVSIVVLDGGRGDLLASANYPLPNQSKLRDLDAQKVHYYSDNRTPDTWKAYTDFDLGLFYETAPGSTSKVMSAMAGLRNGGTNVGVNKEYTYNIHPKERILVSPYPEPSGKTDMKRALVESSNCYFINSSNRQDLYDDMAYIYGTVGASVSWDQKDEPIMKSYSLHYTEATSEFCQYIREKGDEAINTFNSYITKRDSLNQPRKMSSYKWKWAWGQGGLTATPLAMARVASTVVNNGDMPITHYILDESVKTIPVISPAEALMLNGFMKSESKDHSHFKVDYIGGKTGTAERNILYIGDEKATKVNDGWYLCFLEGTEVSQKIDGVRSKEKSPLAVCVRIERPGYGGSTRAREMTNDVVLNVLRELGYINE